MSERCLIVLPCFNEAERFQPQEIFDFLDHCPHFDAYLVDDGSTDGTLAILHTVAQARKGRVHVLQLGSNMGKAEAVRKGVLSALGRGEYTWIAFADADMATPLRSVAEMHAKAALDELMMVTGARVQRMGANIHRKWWRHIAGRIVATLIARLINLPYYDTQCGAKVLRADLAMQVFEKEFVSTWLFDVEVILRLKLSAASSRSALKLYEYPLEEWKEVAGSKVKLTYVWKLPIELTKIYWSYR